MREGALASIFGGFMKFGEYFVLLLYLNVLWILFTALGAVALGWAPALAAVFAVIRERLMGKQTNTWKKFWSVYKELFVKANIIGFIIMLFGSVLYTNIELFTTDITWVFIAIRFVTIGVIVVASLMLLYVFPLLVHYEAPILTHVKGSLQLIIYRPFRTILLVGACILLSQFLYVFPIFIIFLGISLSAFVIMFITRFTFAAVEKRNEQLEIST
ncbi:DUF624 domain-containing protein [Paenalkalicoccus suaedae]|uniref:DUF624 domain-containing protein n=1 Tax=Paenalkalicoccus suaedae TaxID=2592382 RepID=A0A859F9I4_9BACI|nr:DUF624 domain-containing protein [Paenalkalicoccus suaedae]QKS69749.1 DUF624 domain-containing protein [Paenalkalicoccus suaedae]